MPTALLEHQHELTDPDNTVSLVFGTASTYYLTTSYPVIGGGDEQTGDVSRVREDGIALGEDYTGSKSISFEIAVLSDDGANITQTGSDRLNAFELVWKSRKFRSGATKYAILRSMVGGRTRRAYGRPRRYDEQAGQLTIKGSTPIVCDFIVPDGTWYDDDEQSVSISMHASIISGLIAPLVTPLTTTTDPVSTTGMTIGGTKETWPVITIHGPVINPKVQFNSDLTVALNTALLNGESVTIDTHPWARTVQRENGANIAGDLTWETPKMSNMALEPGNYDVTMRGTDLTGTAYVEVAWRNAYPRW